MGKTWDEINEILGDTGVLTDPAVLRAHVYGSEATVSDREVVVMLVRLVSGLVAAIEVLAKDVDDLRAAREDQTEPT